MMTEDGFRAYLRPYLDQGIPFSAYWHPNGIGLLRTGPVPTLRREYILHVPGKPAKRYRNSPAVPGPDSWVEPVSVPGKPTQVSARTLNRWQRNIERLKKSCPGRVITVDFDGTSAAIEGGFEL